MGKVLFIDACVRSESRTRALARCLLERLGDDYAEICVTDGSILPLDSETLDKRTEKIRNGELSDDEFALARQFAAAETVVIAAPFWDLSFPSYLKIYFENILVSGLTFTYRSGKPEGLCRAKSLFYVTTAGGFISQDFGFSYVKALAEAFFGIPEVKCFRAEGLDIIGNDVAGIMNDATEKICREVNNDELDDSNKKRGAR